MTNHDTISIPLTVKEQIGVTRVNEPVTAGIPFPQGMVFDPSCLTLWDATGQPLSLQTQVIAQWFDGSTKWVLLDFQASVEANTQVVYQLRPGAGQSIQPQSPNLAIQESAKQIVVDTGNVAFFLNRQLGKPFDQILIQGTDLIETKGSSLVLTDEAGQEYYPHIHDFRVETTGSLRVTVRAQGALQSASRAGFARFDLRLSFHAGSGIVEIRITLHNPRSAQHQGGLWDLGDEGSIYFKDLSLHLPLRTQKAPQITWTTESQLPLKKHAVSDLEIYQDSSGGENWRSSNHVNRFGKVMQTFRGYRVTSKDSLIEEGLRATPILAVRGENGSVAATVEKFWQNFPKALEVEGCELTLRLFPQQFGDVFELQGGEQKTHTIYLQFSGPKEGHPNLGWVHDRLRPRATPEWYADSKACYYLSPLNQDQNSGCRELIEGAIAGPQSFLAKREIIDEYGWRNFGDLYADHEAVGHTGEAPLVTHYNNQYDVIYGAVVEYLRGGDSRWFDLMHDLARHVIDIDIYHTQNDRPSYNGGLFWHTDHYLDAATATHRSYSKAALTKKDARSYGGGPSNEHNYTSGLLSYYFLTGDITAHEAVLNLAEWVINMDDGSHRFLGWLDRRPTGFCSSTTSRAYHGPGRGVGNSLNTLLDAYTLTLEKRYFTKAEEIIRRCIHPHDDIQDRRLDEPEYRWSYLVFLQVLGKYLDFKVDKGENDYMYGYAQAGLLHYAKWMLEHEVPYATMLDKVEIPTETWPAQDIRKSVVFHVAAKHALGPLRDAFRERGTFFFQACIRDLRSFPTWRLTRPIALLLANAYVHPYFQQHPEETAPQPKVLSNFGQPQPFSPQLAELYWAREKLSTWIRTLREKGQTIRSFVQKKQSSMEIHDG
jgi:hypothetical protein